MGFNKNATAIPATSAAPVVVTDGSLMAEVAASSESRKVRGQVRMHGIMTGYKVAAILAPTLANTASGIKDEFHKLALEVAAKVEEYSFL